MASSSTSSPSVVGFTGKKKKCRKVAVTEEQEWKNSEENVVANENDLKNQKKQQTSPLTAADRHCSPEKTMKLAGKRGNRRKIAWRWRGEESNTNWNKGEREEGRSCRRAAASPLQLAVAAAEFRGWRRKKLGFVGGDGRHFFLWEGVVFA